MDVGAVTEIYTGCGQAVGLRLIPSVQLDAGLLSAIYGGASGLTATGAQAFSQSSSAIPDSPEAGDAFGGTQ